MLPQISDHSRECTEHMDPLFSRQLHTTCSLDGGDGLAFVLHRDPREAAAVGSPGAEMGYGGLRDSLAVSQMLLQVLRVVIVVVAVAVGGVGSSVCHSVEHGG